MGTLIRIGLTNMETFPGTPVPPLLHAHLLGCFLMGLFTAGKQGISDVSAVLFLTLSTGLCGSITTFSSWQLQTWLSWSNYAGYPYRTIWQDVRRALNG
jgi:CrcB protein